MSDLVHRALSAKRESKYIEFKSTFDPAIAREWCELVKDIVAIANSGGGIIVFGLGNQGIPTGAPVDAIAGIDPADIGNKISKYTGPAELELDIVRPTKDGHGLVAFIIHSVSIPLVFQKPGTYDVGSGHQRTAFSSGTVYFRHGAKSEPGTTDDIRKVIERQLEHIRKSWLKGVRKVVQAPAGSQVVTVSPVHGTSPGLFLPSTVRAVNDPTAIPVRLTRDPAQASGTFVHEELSEGIFDEINNVIDANQALARGQQRFFLGQEVYYRIYAERHHVTQPEEAIDLLLHSGLSDFYAPFLFWMVSLPPRKIASALGRLYLHSKNPHIHALMRTAIVLGPEFCHWLYSQWHAKWKSYSQPPSFYLSFKNMIQKAEGADYRFIAGRASATTQFDIGNGATISATEALDSPETAAAALSKACMCVFQGTSRCRSIARNLDYLVYGPQLRPRAMRIHKAILAYIGNRAAGDLIDSDELE